MSGHVHDLEPQLVCETCGHRESLPAGFFVLDAAQVEQVRWVMVRAAKQWGDSALGDCAREALSLLGEQT